MVCDSNTFMYCQLTQGCVSSYERQNRCRITEFTQFSLVRLRAARIRWVSKSRFWDMFGEEYGRKLALPVLVVDELDVIDSSQIEFQTSKLGNLYAQLPVQQLHYDTDPQVL